MDAPLAAVFFGEYLAAALGLTARHIALRSARGGTATAAGHSGRGLPPRPTGPTQHQVWRVGGHATFVALESGDECLAVDECRWGRVPVWPTG